jgi:hypothetical protein
MPAVPAAATASPESSNGTSSTEDGEYEVLDAVTPVPDPPIIVEPPPRRGAHGSRNSAGGGTIRRDSTPYSSAERQFDKIEASMLSRATTAQLAEKEMLGLARFTLGSRDSEVEEERRRALCKSNALKSLVSLIDQYRTTSRVATVGFSVIIALAARDTAMQQALGTAGAVEVIAECINFDGTSSSDERMTEAGLRALSALTWTPGNRESMREQRAIDKVISIMARTAQSAAIQTECATLLANCAFGSEANKMIIGHDLPGVDCLVTAMKQHPMDVELQSRSCLAIRNLTYRLPVIADSAGSKGAVAAVLTAMDLHCDNVYVVEQGSVALYNMVSDNKANTSRMLGDALCLEIILGALREHEKSDTVQSNVVGILQTAAHQRPDYIPSLARAGGLQAIIASMRAGMTSQTGLHKRAQALHDIISIEAPHRLSIDESLADAACVTALIELLYIAVTVGPSVSDFD